MTRGQLKVFLGYAAGVGKTYQMLREAQELRRQRRDVVIGYFEPHGRVDTIAQTEGLEFVPRRSYDYRGAAFEDMDTEALIARHPAVAVVDEFAHTNAPGAPRLKRWQDVEALRDAGIDVLTSLNIQHIESLNDQVWHVTGIRVRETVPDWVLREATEVVMVDVTPRALLHRLERGVVYSKAKAAKALENFFSESNLTALRELAMRETAQQIEERVAPLIPQPVIGNRPARNERILLWLTHHPSSAMLIRRGRRVADYLNCPCTAVLVERHRDFAAAQHLKFCENLRIDTEILESNDPPRAITEYARAHGITQIFVTRDAPDLWRLVRRARDLQVIIVAERVRPDAGCP